MVWHTVVWCGVVNGFETLFSPWFCTERIMPWNKKPKTA